MPQISVIVAVYNAEEYLGQCLNSLINQTYQDIEIICVNDGSTDNSLNILNEYQAKDKRIRIINKQNGGPSSARNEGLKFVKSKYVTFVDADDYLDCNTYETVLKFMEKADIVCFGTKIFGNTLLSKRKSDEKYFKIKYKGLVNLTDQIKQEINVSSCNKIFKMKIISDNQISYPDGMYYEDNNFYWKYILFCKKAFILDKSFYNYRRCNESVMASTFNGTSKAIDHLYIVKDFYDYLCKRNLLDKNLKFLSEIFESSVIFAYRYSPVEQKTEILKLSQEYANTMFKDRKANKFIKSLINGEWKVIYEPKLNLWQKIFSIKNQLDKKHKIITLCGIKIKLRRHI